MTEWLAGMGIIAGFLGLLIGLAWLGGWAIEEGVRGIRDIWHEDDEDEDEDTPKRYRRRRAK